MTESSAATPAGGGISATGLVRRVNGRHGTVTLLGGLDIDVVPGTVTGVIGASLTGKTTLVSILAGWEAPDAGNVVGPRAGAAPWSALAVLPQGFALVDELTVAENILLAQRFGDVAVAPERLSEVCAAIGIEHLLGRFVTEISVGERQRTMAARALVGRPGCILADEPIAHQDERNGRTLLAMLRAAADGGAAVLIASRSPGVVETVADRTVALAPPVYADR